MELKLELLEYQETAIKSLVDVFDGSVKNNFDKPFARTYNKTYCRIT